MDTEAPLTIDVNIVLKKLQNRLVDAITTITILEAQIETLQLQHSKEMQDVKNYKYEDPITTEE